MDQNYAGTWKEIFLDSLTVKPIVSHACKMAKVSRNTAYKHYRKAEKDPEDNFNVDWDTAMEAGLDTYEESLVQIGMGQIKGGNVTAFIYLLNVRRYAKKTGNDMPSELTLTWGPSGNFSTRSTT